MRRCCPSVTPAGITASSVSPVTGCFICRCCPGTAPAGTATSYCSSLGVLIMAAAKIRTVDMYAFVNKHCGYIYETCDWRAGKGNVHFSAAGFEALAGEMARRSRASPLVEHRNNFIAVQWARAG